MCNKISIDKRYRTRGGLDIRIVAVDLGGSHPVVACSMPKHLPAYLRTYTLDGRCSSSNYDLVEIQTAKYLKSIQQILEENPNAYFNKVGTLEAVGKIPILPAMLSSLGKAYEDREVGYTYDESYIEEREEV